MPPNHQVHPLRNHGLVDAILLPSPQVSVLFPPPTRSRCRSRSTSDRHPHKDPDPHEIQVHRTFSQIHILSRSTSGPGPDQDHDPDPDQDPDQIHTIRIQIRSRIAPDERPTKYPEKNPDPHNIQIQIHKISNPDADPRNIQSSCRSAPAMQEQHQDGSGDGKRERDEGKVLRLK